MNRSLKAFLPFTVLALVSACDKPPKSSAATRSSNQDLVVQDLDKLEARLRIAAINKRIDELERKVGKIETTSEKLELALLSQQVTALKVKANDTSVSNLGRFPFEDRFSDSNLNSRVAQKGPATQRKPTRPPTLKLPNLEKGPRLATPTEAKAFSPGK